MPEPYKSQLLPEARTPMMEFETASDFLLMGYKWWRLPNSIQYWFDVHDNMYKIFPKF